MNSTALHDGTVQWGRRTYWQCIFVVIIVFLFSGHACTMDFKDYPVSDDLAGILGAYENMSLEDRFNELPANIGDYVKQHPGDPLGYYLRGIVDMDMQEFEGALSAFGTALALAPEFADAHAQSALALIYSRRVDSSAGATSTLALAASAIGRALELNPRRPDFQSIATSVYIEQGEFEAAAGAMGQAALMVPDSVVYHQQLAALFLQTGHPHRAEEEINLATILNFDANPRALSTREDLFDSQAPLQTSVRQALAEPVSAINELDDLLAQQRYSESASRSLELLTQFPNHPELLYRAALSFWNAFQDMETTTGYLDRALNESPLFSPAIELQCVLRFRAGQAGETAVEDNLSHQASDCMSLANRAYNATQALDALSVTPDNVQRLLSVGGTLVQLDRPDRALPYLAVVTILDPDNSEAVAELMAVRRSLGLEPSAD